MPVKPTFLDRAIGYFSPLAEARRYRARILANELRPLLGKRGYEGASRGRRTDGWRASGGSANAALVGNLDLLRNRSRDLVRNNPWGGRAVSVIASNTVATGIFPQTRAASESLIRQCETLWKEWGDESACDADGRADFYGLQALVMRTIAESGEALVVRQRRTSKDKLPVPIQIRVLEPDFLDTTRDRIESNGNKIAQGIEFDSRGRRVAYWLFDEHPGEYLTRGRLTSTRVAASEVLHIFRQDRAGQIRGVPWGASVFLRMRDLDDYEDAQLVRQKVAACFAAFVHDIEGGDDSASTSSSSTFDVERLEPGIIETLPPGKEVSFGTPPQMSGYSEHTSSVLRAIAIGFGVSYEALTGNLSDVNFSSGRMGWLEFQRQIDQWRSYVMMPQMCKPVWNWFVDAAIMAGRLPASAGAVWTPPRREMIDPVKETEAQKAQVLAGISSLSEVIRQNGKDPADVFKEHAEDRETLKRLGLTFDSIAIPTTAAK